MCTNPLKLKIISSENVPGYSISQTTIKAVAYADDITLFNFRPDDFKAISSLLN
jgi:hypothetical protein